LLLLAVEKNLSGENLTFFALLSRTLSFAFSISIVLFFWEEMSDFFLFLILDFFVPFGEDIFFLDFIFSFSFLFL
jgi:hypothetical protein